MDGSELSNSPMEGVDIHGKHDYKLFKLLIAACFSLYTAMMCAKSVFVAELVTFIAQTGVDKVTASLANTYYFITYAVVQVFLAFFMNKLNVRRYLVVTVPVAAVCGIAVAFAGNDIVLIWVLFAIQGAFQAGIYAGCMYVLSTYLPQSLVSVGNGFMQGGFAIGNTVAYIISAIFVALGAWRVPYVFFGIVFLCATVFFGVVTAKVAKKYPHVKTHRENSVKELKETHEHDSELFFNRGLFTFKNNGQKALFYVLSVLYSVIATALYYAVNNWVGNYLKEVFGFTDSVSIIISVVVPIMSFFGPIMAIAYSKKHKNYIKSSVLFALIPLIAAGIMIFAYDFNAVIAVIVVAAFIVGTKMLTGLQSVATFDMRTELNTGSYTAMVNAAASVSAGIAPTIVGKIIEDLNNSSSVGDTVGKAGWLFQFANAAVIGAFLLLFMAIVYFLTKRKTNLNQEKLY